MVRGGGGCGAHKPGLFCTSDSVDSGVADAPLVEGSVDGRCEVGHILRDKAGYTSVH